MGMRVQADGDKSVEDAVVKLKAAVQETLKVTDNISVFQIVAY